MPHKETVFPFLVLQWHNCKHLSTFPTSLQAYRKKEIHNVHTITVLHSSTLCTHCNMPGVNCAWLNGKKLKYFPNPNKSFLSQKSWKTIDQALGLQFHVLAKREHISFQNTAKEVFSSKRYLAGSNKGHRLLEAVGGFAPIASSLWHLIFLWDLVLPALFNKCIRVLCNEDEIRIWLWEK